MPICRPTYSVTHASPWRASRANPTKPLAPSMSGTITGAEFIHHSAEAAGWRFGAIDTAHNGVMAREQIREWQQATAGRAPRCDAVKWQWVLLPDTAAAWWNATVVTSCQYSEPRKTLLLTCQSHMTGGSALPNVLSSRRNSGEFIRARTGRVISHYDVGQAGYGNLGCHCFGTAKHGSISAPVIVQ